VQNVTDPDVLQILHQIACDVQAAKAALAEIKALVQPKAKKPAQPTTKLDDGAWLAQLCTAPAYQGIDVMKEWEKAKMWCSANNRQPTRRFFINWLNKIERPMQVQATKKDLPPVMYRKVEVPKQGEAPPPEVAKALSRLLGKDFSFGGKA